MSILRRLCEDHLVKTAAIRDAAGPDIGTPIALDGHSLTRASVDLRIQSLPQGWPQPSPKWGART
jgi:hypothetical protein